MWKRGRELSAWTISFDAHTSLRTHFSSFKFTKLEYYSNDIAIFYQAEPGFFSKNLWWYSSALYIPLSVTGPRWICIFQLFFSSSNLIFSFTIFFCSSLCHQIPVWYCFDLEQLSVKFAFEKKNSTSSPKEIFFSSNVIVTPSVWSPIDWYVGLIVSPPM